jgi:hypothetical protein
MRLACGLTTCPAGQRGAFARRGLLRSVPICKSYIKSSNLWCYLATEGGMTAAAWWVCIVSVKNTHAWTAMCMALVDSATFYS